MTSWVRLWHDMPTDPKFRTIAKAAKRPLSEVVAVFVFMLADASANATERGRTQANDEDIASAFDMEEAHIFAIREAMQGRVLDGERLKGWNGRQPKREDESAERARAWREKQKEGKKEEQPTERNRTQPNAPERPDTDTDTEIERKETNVSQRKKLTPDDIKTALKAKRGSRLPADWTPSLNHRTLATTEGLTHEQHARELEKFRDYWASATGPNATKLDWDAAFRNWIRKAAEQFRGSGGNAAPRRGGSAPDLLGAYQRAANRFGD